jgi:Asp-tRNA(Asn)/Glu-tRNA(Gln) amidotransferase A subunit family amidase
MADDLAGLGLAEAAARIRDGQITSLELVNACLDRIASLDPDVQAWAHLDPEHARKQAQEADGMRRTGRDFGPLHGVPLGIKDILDTNDHPTEDGSPLHAGRTPGHDASCVAALRQAGAIVMGKTVTTEFATYHPGKTANPHNKEHTPGGSSSGSAAAVASFMVPGALGTQTNGSVIRPASYCGVYGFKPTKGLISRHRVLQLSRTLDHVGTFARSLEDTALLAQTMMVHDARDPDMHPMAAPRLSQHVSQTPPATPRIGFVKTPAWEHADSDVEGAFEELCEVLGKRLVRIELPSAFATGMEWHKTIMTAELAHNLEREYNRRAEGMSESLIRQIEEGRRVTALDYQIAIEGIDALQTMLVEVFGEVDAILCPATTGEAPHGLESTGSPMFATLWTLLGVPALSLPILHGSKGLPIGVQLVGPRYGDAHLLRTATWLEGHIRSETGAPS